MHKGVNPIRNNLLCTACENRKTALTPWLLSPAHPTLLVLEIGVFLFRRSNPLLSLYHLFFISCFLILRRRTLRCWPAPPVDPSASGPSHSPHRSSQFCEECLGMARGSRTFSPGLLLNASSGTGVVSRKRGRPDLAPVLSRRRVPCIAP